MKKNTTKCTNTTETNDNVSAVSKATPYLKGKKMNIETNTKMMPDSFDTASLKFKQKAKKILKTIPCKSIPDAQDYVRVRAGDGWQIETLLVQDEKTRDYYIIAQKLHDQLLTKGFRALLRMAMSHSGDPFIWILKMSPIDPRTESWCHSAMAKATLAETAWVQIGEDRMGYREMMVYTGMNREPQWPDMEFKDVLRLCFNDRFIDSLDHPVVKRLRKS